jgi:hypothetical protein
MSVFCSSLGMHQVFCGNPSQALRSRRSRLSDFQESSPETQKLYSDKDVVFAELKQWQRDYDKLTQALTEQAKVSLLPKGNQESAQAAAEAKPLQGGAAMVQPVSDSISELSQRVASRPVPPRPHSAADFRKRRYRVLSTREHSLTSQLIDEEADPAENEGSLRPYTVPCQQSQPSRTVPYPPTELNKTIPHPPTQPKATYRKTHLSTPRPMTASPGVWYDHT